MAYAISVTPDSRRAAAIADHAELEIMLSEETIATRVAEIGRQIDHDYAGEKILLVTPLRTAT